jgi:hypothetical protein
VNHPDSFLNIKHCFIYPQGDGKPEAVVFVMPGIDPDFVLERDIPEGVSARRISFATAVRICAERQQ